MKITVRAPYYTITIGELIRAEDGSLVFTKNVQRKKHFMKVLSGYGIQKEPYDQYLRGKKGRIDIIEKDTGKTLTASISTWDEHSSYQNYGSGRQVFLSEKYMEVK